MIKELRNKIVKKSKILEPIGRTISIKHHEDNSMTIRFEMKKEFLYLVELAFG